MSWHDTLLFSGCMCMCFIWLWCVLRWGAVKSCQPGGVWAGLWLDSLCGRQSSMNQTLIVSPPQGTIRCLTNHMSVFLPPTPTPSLSCVLSLTYEGSGGKRMAIVFRRHCIHAFHSHWPVPSAWPHKMHRKLPVYTYAKSLLWKMATQILKKQGTRLPEHVFSDFETYCLVIWVSLLQFMLRVQYLLGNVEYNR